MPAIIRPPVFVHVEKAGGISINNLLHDSIFGYVSPHPGYGYTFDAKLLKKIQQFYPARIVGLGGHRISPTDQFWPNQFRFSFVRTPHQRFISHLNWQIHKMGIPHTLESFANNPHFQNFMTYRLSRKKTFSEAQQIIIENYDFIGLLEDFKVSLAAVSQSCFGNPQVLGYEYKNRTENKDRTYSLRTLSASEKKLVSEANREDELLYNWINNDFFPDSLKKIGDSFPDLTTNKMLLSNRLKRKVSNFYLGRVVQPFLQDKVRFGY